MTDKHNTKKIRILLADDHLVVRMGIASLLSFENDFEVVGEADNGTEAVYLACRLIPDVVLMDLQMPDMDGVEATAKILQAHPSIRILILTTFGTSANLVYAFNCGAAGAIVKSSSQDEIISAIRAVATGRRVVSREIEHTLKTQRALPDLSPRQLEILNLIAKGFSNKEIADILTVSLETVKDHIKKILLRMGASSRTEAASQAIAMNLITG